MRLTPLSRKGARQAEPLLPMIDVVFFLIVFFMIVSRFAEPEPFAVTPPVSGTEAEVAGELALFLGADGEFGLRAGASVLRGEAALAALAARCDGGCDALLLHADMAAPAGAVAAILPRLAAAGFTDIRIVTVRG